MKPLSAATLLLASLLSKPITALAALKAGDAAPPFKTPAAVAGQAFDFDLSAALKKGPVVLYFFPAAETAGCNLEARLFADSIDQFKAQGATVIGVTAGNLDKLASFSADTEKCSGKFPVAADPSAKIAATYDASLAVKPGWSSRTSYVISPSGQVIHAYSDMKANDHVTETLSAVKAWRAKNPK